MSSERETGPVKWFDKAKGYGFITRNTANGEEDVFVHYNAIRGEGFRLLYEGQIVEYSVQKGNKGLQAEDVVILDDQGTPKPSPQAAQESHQAAEENDSAHSEETGAEVDPEAAHDQDGVDAQTND